MKNQVYIYTYQTKNLINGKLYVGVHKTKKLDDGYIGCAVYRQPTKSNSTHVFQKAVIKYGYENFEKEILSFYDTLEEAYEEEKFIVNEEWVARNDTYNIALGGLGGWHHFNKDGKNSRFGKDNPMYGMIGEKNHFFGKTHTKETREKLRQINLGKVLSEETRQKLSDSSPRTSGENHPMWGKTHTDEVKKILVEKLHKRHSDKAQKEKMLKGFKNVKKVQNIQTGEIFLSMSDASKEAKIEYKEFIELLKKDKLENYKILNK